MKKCLLEIINSRRTIRKYKNKKIDREKIKLLLKAARDCQSAHNTQPWEFIVIENKRLIEQIAKLLHGKSKNVHIGFNILLKEASKILMQTPLIIAVYNTKELSEKFSFLGKKYKKLCKLYEIQSIAAAIQNITLTAEILELGLAWLGISVFCEKDINRLIGRKSSLMAILCVGYPSEFPEKPKRKDINKISRFIR